MAIVVQPQIVFPAPFTGPSKYRPEEDYQSVGLMQTLRAIKFELCLASDGRIFYECRECGRAGIPSFHRMERSVPDDVLEQMRIHVEMNHGRERN